MGSEEDTNSSARSSLHCASCLSPLGILHIVTMGTVCRILWILHILAIWTVSAKEYCNLETFDPTCPADHVIMMSRAHYGRMKLGRCLKRDYYVGCSDDVTSILHRRCSGKRECKVAIPNSDLYDRQHCPDDLVSYLEADYSCLKVSDFSNTTCKDNARRVVVGEHEGGFISSRASSVNCPLVLRASPGQKINVTLYEFSDGTSAPPYGHYECMMFATVKEYSGASFRENVVCGSGTHRQELVYSSKTNEILIVMNRAGSASADSHRFLLQYQATGCPDPAVPADMTLRRRGDQLDVRCNQTGQVWHLVCRDNSWVGEFGNCTSDYFDILYDDNGDPRSRLGFPNGIVMAIIVGIILGVMIGFCLLLVVYNIRRKRRKQSQSRAGTIQRQQHQQGQLGKSHESCYGPGDPMLPVVNSPDVTLDKGGCHVICDVTGTVIPRHGTLRDPHVYEKPQSGMEVQYLLTSHAGQNKLEEDSLMMKSLDTGDYGCQFHSSPHKTWHLRGNEHMEIVPPQKCALPT